MDVSRVLFDDPQTGQNLRSARGFPQRFGEDLEIEPPEGVRLSVSNSGAVARHGSLNRACVLDGAGSPGSKSPRTTGTGQGE